ncbi:hypothetical protein Hanom_Chr05g00435051 [Helianthus anomalus]
MKSFGIICSRGRLLGLNPTKGTIDKAKTGSDQWIQNKQLFASVFLPECGLTSDDC